MKKIVIATALAMMGSAVADEPRIVSVQEFVETGKALNEEENEKHMREIILRLAPQETFEYTIRADNPLFKISEDEQKIEIKDTIFFKIENEDLKFSHDGENWQPCGQLFTGCLCVGFSQSDDEEPKLYIDLDFKKRH